MRRRSQKCRSQKAKNPRHRLAGLGGFFTTIRGHYVHSTAEIQVLTPADGRGWACQQRRKQRVLALLRAPAGRHSGSTRNLLPPLTSVRSCRKTGQNGMSSLLLLELCFCTRASRKVSNIPKTSTGRPNVNGFRWVRSAFTPLVCIPAPSTPVS